MILHYGSQARDNRGSWRCCRAEGWCRRPVPSTAPPEVPPHCPNTLGHWLQLCSLPCWAARLLSTCTCSLRTQPSLPGDAWLSDSIPKDHLVQMPWDASSSFPRLISRASHIASCPLCTSLTTFLHPTLLLSSSHDPSLSPFGQHGQNGPVPQCGLTSTATPRHLCLYDKGASHIYSRGLLMG